jgi:hypothetical protein
MSITSILRPRVLVAFALALILSASAYGFAAANNVEATGAGAGAAKISGYEVTDVQYTMSVSSPTEITNVAFTVLPTTLGDPDAANARIKLFDAETSYHTCTVTAVTGATTCTISPAVSVASAINLTVVATSY